MRSDCVCFLLFFNAFFFILISQSVLSQSKSDSLLLAARDKDNSVKERLSAFADLVFYFESRDPDKALSLGVEGASLSSLVNDSLINDLARLYVNVAFVYYSSQEYEKAIPEFEKAAVLYKKAGEVRKEGIQYQNIGVMHRKLGNYSESINYQLKSLKKLDEAGDLMGQINVYFNIGAKF